MSSDPIRGKTLRWSYDTGVMAGRTFATASSNSASADDSTARYMIERLNDSVYVVSYLSKSGYTLTTVIDEKTGAIVSVASNEKQLSTFRGSVDGAKAA